jgi:hypothetical protein
MYFNDKEVQYSIILLYPKPAVQITLNLNTSMLLRVLGIFPAALMYFSRSAFSLL